MNGALLGADWQAFIASLGANAHPPANATGLLLWLLVALLFGCAGAWIYVTTFALLGSKPRAWLAASACLWSAGWLTSALGQLAVRPDDGADRARLPGSLPTMAKRPPGGAGHG